jgi:hypothetical protein
MALIPLHHDIIIAILTTTRCCVAEHEQSVAALHCAAGEDGHRAGEGDGRERGDERRGVGQGVEGVDYV